jgi:hypothetical protein
VDNEVDLAGMGLPLGLCLLNFGVDNTDLASYAGGGHEILFTVLNGACMYRNTMTLGQNGVRIEPDISIESEQVCRDDITTLSEEWVTDGNPLTNCF